MSMLPRLQSPEFLRLLSSRESSGPDIQAALQPLPALVGGSQKKERDYLLPASAFDKVLGSTSGCRCFRQCMALARGCAGFSPG